jgi:simple sugar transport system ATP-binding protein
MRYSNTARESAGATEPLVALRGITKTFPNVIANDHVDLDVYSGEVHALLGENGAGKSTLVKILYGFYRADSGQILLDGKPVSIRSPHDARNMRIGMVFQEFTLIPAFSVAENIALFLPDLKAVLNTREIDQRIKALSQRYGLNVDPRAMVSHLTIGEQLSRHAYSRRTRWMPCSVS